MSIVHLHLLLNHFPVIGALFAVLLLALALVRRSGELSKVAFGFLGFLGLVSVIVFLTGEPAEESVEKLPGFSEAIAGQHEDIALVAMLVMGLVGVLALAMLVAYRRRVLPRSITGLGLAATLGAAALMGYTANLGGQIRHTEIRSGAVAAAPAERGTSAGERGEAGER